jgi:hypothetical protein
LFNFAQQQLTGIGGDLPAIESGRLLPVHKFVLDKQLKPWRTAFFNPRREQ